MTVIYFMDGIAVVELLIVSALPTLLDLDREGEVVYK
jgi:hypothetical protein